MHCYEFELMRAHLLYLARRQDPGCRNDPQRLGDVLDAYRIDSLAALLAQSQFTLDLMAQEACARPRMAA